MALEGESRLERVVLAKNRLEGAPFHQSARPTGETFALPCGILFRSIGYRGVSMEGVPFDEKAGVFRNVDGRITEDGKMPVPGLYVAGWIKRGPTGVIGTNKKDATETVELLLADARGGRLGRGEPAAAPWRAEVAGTTPGGDAQQPGPGAGPAGEAAAAAAPRRGRRAA